MRRSKHAVSAAHKAIGPNIHGFGSPRRFHDKATSTPPASIGPSHCQAAGKRGCEVPGAACISRSIAGGTLSTISTRRMLCAAAIWLTLAR
ncbi:hypothetical protein D3C75_1204080 [compost metagenome]